MKFVDFPAALGSYRLALTDIWYRCTARGPLKTHTIFFSGIFKLNDFQLSRFNRILGLEEHRFFGHEVHHLMGLKANIVTLRIQRNMRMWADDLCL